MLALRDLSPRDRRGLFSPVGVSQVGWPRPERLRGDTHRPTGRRRPPTPTDASCSPIAEALAARALPQAHRLVQEWIEGAPSGLALASSAILRERPQADSAAMARRRLRSAPEEGVARGAG